MEPTYEILTARLRLRALSLEEVRLLARGQRAALGERLQATVPDEWPGPHLARALPSIYASMAERAGDQRWVWAVIAPAIALSLTAASAAVVGDVGFHGPVRGARSIEIGYVVFPSARGRGYAAEATAALIEWAFAQPGVERVIAKIAPENARSLRVAAAVGMRETTSDEPDFLCFERLSASR
ncbi:MAG: GNAT family N-acetyltransferase [Ktedonobacterales bacterium]|nr:GNAT family N-acetyltransferase [Ktedonobacterales bacterium]